MEEDTDLSPEEKRGRVEEDTDLSPEEKRGRMKETAASQGLEDIRVQTYTAKSLDNEKKCPILPHQASKELISGSTKACSTTTGPVKADGLTADNTEQIQGGRKPCGEHWRHALPDSFVTLDVYKGNNYWSQPFHMELAR